MGDKVQYEGYDFRVLETNGLRISRLRVSKTIQAEAIPVDNPKGSNPKTVAVMEETLSEPPTSAAEPEPADGQETGETK